MARRERVSLLGVPQHVIQRGNNRQVCFVGDEDFEQYESWLKAYSIKYGVEIHAWVFMTNHVHLLCTPLADKAISLMMQALGRQYVRYFNGKYRRTGTLWEGRFKSSIVDAEAYLFELYRYIELNPVRAGMVALPEEYYWSSYRVNALGELNDLCTPHVLLLGLGRDSIERMEHYRALFDLALDDGLMSDVRKSTSAGMAIGREKFKSEMALLAGRRVSLGVPGRPKKTKV
jgi:putative transposase